jgi:hypothetical protein
MMMSAEGGKGSMLFLAEAGERDDYPDSAVGLVNGAPWLDAD